AVRDDLQQRHAAHQRRQAALAREHELWDTAGRAMDEAERAEERGEDEQALRSCARALTALDQILIDGCTPEIEVTARARRETLNESRARLARRSLTRRLLEQARSPDPRQRQEALRLAEELLPDWSELPQLREQIRQIDACLAILERAQAAEPAV